MTNTATIVMTETPRAAALVGAAAIGEAAIIDMPHNSLGCNVAVTCSDGATLGCCVYDLSEFLFGMRRNEVIPRLIACRQRYAYVYLILGFILQPSSDGLVRSASGQSTGWNYQAVQGQLLSIQEIGVGIVQMQHEKQLADQLSALARRSRATVRALPNREALFFSPAEQVLMALPNIGEDRADALLRHCGNAATALQALTDDTMSVAGIGAKIKADARKALGIPDGYALGLYPATTKDQS